MLHLTSQHHLKETMKIVGCTTPYVPNKSQICTDPKVGLEALEIYRKIFDRRYANPCKSPCNYVTLRAMKTKDSFQPWVDGKKTSVMNISTRENIKVTKGLWLYSELSLVAEIGGYVGLFLGISILQIRKLIDLLLVQVFGRERYE